MLSLEQFYSSLGRSGGQVISMRAFSNDSMSNPAWAYPFL